MKTIALFFSLIFFAISLQAQEIIIKAKGGLGMSYIRTDSMNPLGANNGLVSPVGFIGIDYLQHKLFGLSSNIGYVRKGAKHTNYKLDSTGSPQGTVIEKTIFDYISINTTINAKFPVTKQFQPFLCAGPRIDCLINWKDGAKLITDTDTPNRFSVGLVLGGGLNYQINKIQIGLDFSYYMNFNKIVQLRDFYNRSVWDRTAVACLSLGYSI